MDKPVRLTFINLAVRDLQRSVDFFTALGFSFDQRFTDENATCMIISDQAYVMLLTEAFFRQFARKKMVDAHSATEVMVAVNLSSRAEVDELADKALAAGASPAAEPQEVDGMYGRSFYDLDGHHWEVGWLDPKALTS